MIRRPPRSTRTDTLFPYTTLFRSDAVAIGLPFRLPRRLRLQVPWADARIAVDALVHQRMGGVQHPRSEEHTSELQSLMRISYAVFCLKKKHTDNKFSTSQ